MPIIFPVCLKVLRLCGVVSMTTASTMFEVVDACENRLFEVGFESLRSAKLESATLYIVLVLL